MDEYNGEQVEIQRGSNSDFSYDFFVSHSDSDSEWVHNWLVPFLNGLGLSTYSKGEFLPGIPILTNYERAVNISRYTLLVLSNEWVSDEWIQFSAQLAKFADPTGNQQRILPVLLQVVTNLPPHIGSLTPIDLTAQDERAANLKLAIQALYEAPAKPQTFLESVLTKLKSGSRLLAMKEMSNRERTVVILFEWLLIPLTVNIVSNRVDALLYPQTSIVVVLLLSFLITRYLIEFNKIPILRSIQTAFRRPLPRFISVIGLIFLVYVVYRPPCLEARCLNPCPTAPNCVLVAEFAPTYQQDSKDMTNQLIDELERIVATATEGESESIQIGKVGSIDSEDDATKVANRHRAPMIIWGKIITINSEQRVRVYFELVDMLDVNNSQSLVRPLRIPTISHWSTTFEVECIGVQCLELEQDVVSNMKVLSNFAIGLSLYIQGKYEKSEQSFLQTLHCAGQALPPSFESRISPCGDINTKSGAEFGIVYYYLGRSLSAQGDYEAAIEQLTIASNENPDDPAIWVGIALAYAGWLNDDQSPEALYAFHTATMLANNIKTIDEGANKYFLLGMIEEQQHHYSLASANYRQAVELARTDNSAYLSLLALARVQAALGDVASATQTLDNAGHLYPKSPWHWLDLAKLSVLDRPSAEAYLAHAKSFAPNESYVYISWAELCTEWKDWDCALREYQHALTIRQNSGWLYSRLGDTYRRMATINSDPVLSLELWEASAESYKNAILYRPHDPWGYQRYSFALRRSHNYADAAQQHKSAMQYLHPNSLTSEWYCVLSEIQYQANLVDEARLSAGTCLSTARDEDTRLRAVNLLGGLYQ